MKIAKELCCQQVKMQESSGAGSEIHGTGERSGHGRLWWSKDRREVGTWQAGSEIRGTGERSGHGRLWWSEIRGTGERWTRQAAVVVA